eukprot:999231-Alexandrium_andersonii.AAC.1
MVSVVCPRCLQDASGCVLRQNGVCNGCMASRLAALPERLPAPRPSSPAPLASAEGARATGSKRPA